MTTAYNSNGYIEAIVYKITDVDTGKFYIGETTRVERFNNGTYNGSGASNWIEYYEKYKHSHSFKREILKDNFNTFEDYKVDKSTGCMNEKTTKQWEAVYCPECGVVGFHHYKTCSEYNEIICGECGGKGGHHKKVCSKFEWKTSSCPECGSIGSSHRKTCSRFIVPKLCLECGRIRDHKKCCSKYNIKQCSEYGRIKSHLKTCSKYNRNPCSECGSTNGHKDSCSKSKGKCPEC